MIRVGLADDEPLLSAGLAMLLGAQGDLEVAWCAVDGADAVRRQRAQPVDVLLMDVQMPTMDGLEATRALLGDGGPATCRVLVLTTFDTDGYVLGAIEAGASGFLLKSTPPEELVAAIRTVHAGDAVVSPGPTRRLLGAVRAAPSAVTTAAGTSPGDVVPAEVASLTGREREVLALVARGLTNQEICDRLWLSMPTVKTHVSHLLAKTGARDRVQLVLTALRGGVVDLDSLLVADEDR